MNGRNNAARILVALGAMVLIAGALLHCMAAYPKVSTAVSASNLGAPLQRALRTVFLLVGWDWIVIAIIRADARAMSVPTNQPRNASITAAVTRRANPQSKTITCDKIKEGATLRYFETTSHFVFRSLMRPRRFLCLQKRARSYCFGHATCCFRTEAARSGQ